MSVHCHAMLLDCSVRRWLLGFIALPSGAGVSPTTGEGAGAPCEGGGAGAGPLSSSRALARQRPRLSSRTCAKDVIVGAGRGCPEAKRGVKFE